MCRRSKNIDDNLHDFSEACKDSLDLAVQLMDNFFFFLPITVCG